MYKGNLLNIHCYSDGNWGGYASFWMFLYNSVAVKDTAKMAVPF